MDESGIEATQALDFGDYEDDITDDEQSGNNPIGYLNVARQKGFPGKQFPVFEGDSVIGRGDHCKICIPLKALSREHACIEVKGDSHFIYDKGSRNRTRRNNHFLAASVRYELKHNDKLIFGDVECEFTIGVQAADDDDGDETGSESMFQTAPGDDTLDDAVDTNDKTEVKPPDDEDFASDASSDILEPTQPFAGNTQSMLGNRTCNGNSTLAQNITVKETPAISKTKRFTEDLVLPESDSDTENERSPSKPPATMAVVADSQEDDDEDENEKSRMMVAATQAYVCESDVTTDDEDSVRNKSSILAAPTQAFLDDDVSTCSEDSPEKKILMTAATQAFVTESDDDKTPKKSRKIAPTVAYDMDTGIEPTQGYDMDADTDDEREEKEEEQKSSGIMFEPTQAYVGKGIEDEKENAEDGKSDTSEEFVLEGDTDAEDSDAAEMLAAPTLAVDVPGECETDVKSPEDQTQVVNEKGEEGATVAVVEEATQVFDEPKTVSPRGKKGKKTEKTRAIFEAETQVFQDNDETDSKQSDTNDDATQVFDQGIVAGKEQRKSAEPDIAETQVFDEDHTDHSNKSIAQKVNEQVAETQVFTDDATQCFNDKNDSDNTSANIAETQVFEEVDEITKNNTNKKVDASKQEEMATQEFEEDKDAAAEGDEEGETFDITAASTLAFNAEPGDVSETEEDEEEVVEEGEGATQVFEEADQTAAVGDDQTQQVKSETTSERLTSKRKLKKVEETVAVAEEATQVFEDKSVKTKAPRGRRKQVVNDTVAVSDDATQVFDETVAVSAGDQSVSVEDINSKTKQNRSKKDKKTESKVSKHEAIEDATQVFDETVAVSGEDQTVSVEVLEKKTRGKKRGKVAQQARKEEVGEDATQVFDETVAVSETVPVEEIEKNPKPSGRGKSKKSAKMVKGEVNEDATQVFDETVAVSETVPVEEIEKNPKPGGKRKGKKSEQTMKEEVNEDATQVFDETVAVSVEDQTVSVVELETKPDKKHERKKGKNNAKQESTEDATQIFDETVADDKNVDLNTVTESEEKSEIEKADMEHTAKTQPVSEDIDVNSEVEEAEKQDDACSRKGKRTRGKCPIVKNVKNNTTKNKKSNTKEINEKTEEVVGNVRKSGRTRGKAAMSGNVDVNSGSKLSSGNGKDVQEVENKTSGKKRGGKNKEEKIVEPDLEPATQIYADTDEDDGAATQRYEDVEDDDQTPDLADIEEEKNVNVQVVEAESTRGRSPLKSALASPKKKKSPSPKKVQFVSQNSETGSESGEPSRRSKRGNKGLKKAIELPNVEHEIEKTTENSKPAPTAAKKRTMRGKESVKTEKVEESKKVEDSKVENEDERLKDNDISEKGMKTKSVLETKTDSDNTSEPSSEVMDKITAKPTRRGGRRSVAIVTDVKKIGANKRTRTSLPNVLEEAKPETSQQLDKLNKDNEIIAEKEVVIESKVSGKKNVKVKGKNSKQEGSENMSLESCESQETSSQEEAAPEPSGKRSSRSARTNKTRNVREAQSDTTNDNSGISEKNNTTRSQRNSRRKATEDVDVAEDNQVKKRKIDHVIAEGDKREGSPVTSSRSRTSRNKAADNDSSDTKLAEDNSLKSKGKAGKNSRTSASKSENNESNSDGSRSDSVKEENVVTDDTQKVKGKVGKGKKGKSDIISSKIVEDDVKKEQVDNEVVENENKGSTRSKRSKAMKAPPKEEKDELPVEEIGRSRRLKRKESASSSNDSQESERGETPAKRQKKKSVENNATPKPTEKKKTAVNTPKGSSLKELETSVTHSPTLRRKTTDEMKPKVMFTGVVDEHGEKIVKELGGDLVSSVTDCTHLVTDQVRRTVKFLCCLSRGIPIVSPQWLVSSKASGFFLDPSNFLVKDESSERKYKFSLLHAIEKATKEPLFSSCTFKITKSVKPEPQHMKDILKCAGAMKFIDKMPDNAASPLTFVISCPEDQDECEPAYKVGIPVMTAEFVLTGILRQEMDLSSFKLEKKENGNKRQAATSSQDTSKKRKR